MQRFFLAVIPTMTIAGSTAGTAQAHEWFITKVGVEDGMRSYDWDGHAPRNVTCEGIWRDGVRRVKGKWYFRHLWGEMRLPDRRWHFKFHAADKKIAFKTTDWTCGRIGTNPCGRDESDHDDIAKCQALGRVLYLNGVACSQAAAAYSAFLNGAYGSTGGGAWLCNGQALRGRCSERSDLIYGASFSWA